MKRAIHPTLYVSGPVTGHHDDNRPAFEDAAAMLRAAGYRVRIPHDDVAPGTQWVPALKLTLMSMMAQADGLAMLDGWELSRGAQLERNVALALGMPVMTVNEWIHLDR